MTTTKGMLYKVDRRIPIVLSLQHRKIDDEGRCHGYGFAAEEDPLDIFTRSAVVIVKQRIASRQGLENGFGKKGNSNSQQGGLMKGFDMATLKDPNVWGTTTGSNS